VKAIVELAGRLGKAIAEAPEAARLRVAREEMGKDETATKLLKDFREQNDRIDQLQQDGKSIEVEDKHKLQTLREQLTASETFKKFSAAQVDYIDLMRQVNEALQKELADTENMD